MSVNLFPMLTQSQEPRPSPEKWAIIKAAYQAGHFDPFQQSLQWQEDLNERGESFWDVLQEVVNGSSVEALDRSKVKAWHLFSSLVDPRIDGAEKMLSIEGYLASLSDEDRETFLYSLSCSQKIPPCIAVLILKYTSLEVRTEVCRLSLLDSSERVCEASPCNWMKEMAENGGLYPNGGDFIDLLFLCYPPKVKKEMIYFFFSHSKGEEQRNFLAVLNEPLRVEVEDLLAEVDHFLDLSLKETSLKELVRIPFEKNQRAYFLHLFFTRALDRLESFFIAADFNEKDWNQLKAYAKGHSIADLVLRWFDQMVQLAQTGQGNTASQKIRVWQFFCGALNALPARLQAQESKKLEKIAASFPLPLLIENFEVFNDLFLQRLPSEGIFNLFSLYIAKEQIPDRRITVEETIAEMWRKIELARGFISLFHICFKGENQTAFELTIYSSLSLDEQKKILSEILKESGGKAKLFAWCTYSLSEESEKELLPSVKTLIFQELQKMLIKVDPFLPSQLKQELERSGIQQEQIDLLLPPTPTSPEERQQRALHQLHHLFLEREIRGEQLKKLIRSLKDDLQAGMQSFVWIPRLFNRLPNPAWPLLFYYFESDLSSTKHSLKAPIWLPTTEKWIELAAKTLIQVVGNPLLHMKDELSSAVEFFCGVISKTKTTVLVIEQFSKIAPIEKWIPALEALGCGPFRNDQGDFYNLVAISIQFQPNKADFIAERLIAFDLAKRNEKVTRTMNLEVALFGKPFIKTYGEGMAVLSALIKRLNVEFFGYFFRQSTIASKIGEIVKSAPDRGKLILLNWLDTLTQIRSRNELKLSMFQGIASSYTYNPEEFIAFLMKPEFTAVAAKISVWYSIDKRDLVQLMSTSKTNWTLLNHFNEEDFYPAVLSQINYLQQENKWFDIAELFWNLSEMPCKLQLIDKILDEEEMGGFRNAYRGYVQQDKAEGILSNFMHRNEIGATLTLNLVEDWAVQLNQWFIGKLEEEYNRKFCGGDDDGSFYETFLPIYETLEQAGVLESWKRLLQFSLPKEVREEFIAVNWAYQQKNQRQSELEEKS